ncbi:hypothetical protein CYMTET_41874 [Cymbomonas tetramitiformis]|uniref:Uncharacterized protein n=1 Tax=Cymbomonas tetramitiformis TaxID=36881 RepID=A0AAE0C768_9CHLO|nr:hypothetical protein CYMTET_41874 [Cymbomonas tetramitiformis]
MDVADIYTRTLYDASRLYDTNSPQYLAFTVILALTFMSDRQARTVIAFTKPVSEVSKPLLSTTFNPPGANKAALVLAGEVFKVCYSIVSLAVGGQLLANLRGERILRASLPAAIYAFQNWSSQIAYSTLDSVTFNCLNQIKLVSTALCLYLMHGRRQSKEQVRGAPSKLMHGRRQSKEQVRGAPSKLHGRRQSKEQVIAIGMLVASAFLLQGSPTNHGAGLGNRDPAAYQTGVIASLFSSAASGIAGTLCQQILQGESMSPDELNFTMSTTSVVLLLATLLKDPSNRDVSLGGPAVLFSSWSSTALIPILASAVGGICVGQVSASTST